MLATAPDIEAAGWAADGNEALHHVLRNPPDVVVMDIGMPVLDGVGATRLIVGHDPRVRVLLLTGTADGRIDEALRAGACGVVREDAAAEEILHAVRTAAAGGGSPSRTGTRPTGHGIGTAPGGPERTVRAAHVARVLHSPRAADPVRAAVPGRGDHRGGAHVMLAGLGHHGLGVAAAAPDAGLRVTWVGPAPGRIRRLVTGFSADDAVAAALRAGLRTGRLGFRTGPRRGSTVEVAVFAPAEVPDPRASGVRRSWPRRRWHPGSAPGASWSWSAGTGCNGAPTSSREPSGC